MIRLQDLTPEIYYHHSRDFQFIGRLYDIVLNYVKTNVDTISNLPCGKDMDDKLLGLLSTTLGFQGKHHYNSKHLEAVCSVLPTIMRKKGSLGAVIDAVNAMLHAEGIRQTLDYYIDPKKSITLYLPQQLSDLSLIKDLLPYILPAGLGCNLVKELKEVVPVETEFTTQDKVKLYWKSYEQNKEIISHADAPKQVSIAPENRILQPTNTVDKQRLIYHNEIETEFNSSDTSTDEGEGD